jgi:hypothetical protein
MPTDDERTANAGAHRDRDDILGALACAESHLAGQDRIHIVVTYDGTCEPFAE